LLVLQAENASLRELLDYVLGPEGEEGEEDGEVAAAAADGDHQEQLPSAAASRGLRNGSSSPWRYGSGMTAAGREPSPLQGCMFEYGTPSPATSSPGVVGGADVADVCDQEPASPTTARRCLYKPDLLTTAPASQGSAAVTSAAPVLHAL
jgi:hypothetical protein